MVPPLGYAGRLFTSFTGPPAINPASVAARATATQLRDPSRAKISVGNDWQVTDFFNRAEQEPSVIFSEEAIDETATEMLGQSYRVEEPDESLAADAVIQAAEAHMTRNPLHELMPVIRDMLRDPNIQRATMSHLRNSPHFQQYMLTSSAADKPPLALEWQPTTVEQDDAALPTLLEDLGSRFMAAGQAAMKTAVDFRNAIGRLLIHLGANLHALLGKPFSTTPLEENMSEAQMDERAEIVGKALTTVAVAILSIVFLKRANLVTAL